MFVILYRWRVKLNYEPQFIESWSERTAFWREKYDSLGSRLHRGDDEIWYSYAQWKSAEQREQALLPKRAEFPTRIENFKRRLKRNFLK